MTFLQAPVEEFDKSLNATMRKLINGSSTVREVGKDSNNSRRGLYGGHRRQGNKLKRGSQTSAWARLPTGRKVIKGRTSVDAQWHVMTTRGAKMSNPFFPLPLSLTNPMNYTSISFALHFSPFLPLLCYPHHFARTNIT